MHNPVIEDIKKCN